MTQEIFEVKTVMAKTPEAHYRAEQIKSFEWTNTKPNQWKACEIKGMVNGVPIFDIPSNYNVVNPWSSRLNLESNGSNCELCGHEIIDGYPIKCADKQIFMFVGSTCIDTFYNAGYITEKIRVFEDNQIRQYFNQWKKSAITFCSIQYDTEQYGPNTYMIKYDHYKFSQKLNKLNPQLESTQVLKNIFKKARKLGIKFDNSIVELKPQ